MKATRLSASLHLFAILTSAALLLCAHGAAVADDEMGYRWAEENGVTDFDECQDEFGTSIEEDGCNRYVQENRYEEAPTFHGYPCTEDCSGHQAGYAWAEENGLTDVDQCGGNSSSFIEGCVAYVEESQ